MEWTRQIKDEITELAELEYSRLGTGERDADCLRWMICGMLAARRMGIHLLPQAGSADWWTGVEDRGYGYKWCGDQPPAAIAAMFPGQDIMPEIHCWLGHVETQTLIDFTYPYIPAAAKNRKMPWERNEEDFREPLFAVGGELPKGCRYEACLEATSYASKKATDLLLERTKNGA